MQTLSRNKKIGIFSLVIIGITLIGFIGTGNVDMSRLSSSVLNGSTYICTENGQKRNMNEYNKAIRDKQQAEGKIKIMSGEINVLKKTIEGHKKTVASHEETIKKQNATISELTAYISKNCANPKTSREKTICSQKQQQKTNLEQSNKNLSNQITSLNTLIGRLEGQIKQKNDNIATWTKKIEEYTKYIKEYDACTESLKGKLIITSPLMSGEVKMALEVGKRAELYKFSMSMPAPGKAEINQIKFDTAFGPGNIELDDWYVTENSTTTSIYPCRLENNGQFRCALERIESGNFGLENGRVQNYSLSAVVKDIKEPGSFKIYGISKEGVLYNGTRRDADNQSTPIKINYAKKETSPKTDLASFSISAPKTVYVNEPFDLSVKALGTNGSLLQTYVGTIFFDINGNNNSDVIFPTPNNEYTFVSNDYGEHTFQKGITLKKAGQYELVIFELNGPNGGIHGVVNIVAQEKTSTDCSSITGSDVCLKQDGCYYNEKTSKCTSEVLKCEDASDDQDDIFTKGMIWGFARHVYSPRYYQASYDYCTGDTINQVSCDSEGFAKYTSTTCPNGCSDGACKASKKDEIIIHRNGNLYINSDGNLKQLTFDTIFDGSNVDCDTEKSRYSSLSKVNDVYLFDKRIYQKGCSEQIIDMRKIAVSNNAVYDVGTEVQKKYGIDLIKFPYVSLSIVQDKFNLVGFFVYDNTEFRELHDSGRLDNNLFISKDFINKFGLKVNLEPTMDITNTYGKPGKFEFSFPVAEILK